MPSIKEFYTRRYANLPADAPEPDQEGTFGQRVAMATAALPAAPQRILDFGCGRGAASAVFAARGHRVEGVDISATAIEIARTRVPAARFSVIEDETKLPFPDQTFEACYCSEVIEHVFDVTGCLSEIARVLVPHGMLLLTTPYHALPKNLLIALFNFEAHYNVRGGHIRFFTRRSLEKCLGTAGFQTEQFRPLGRFWLLWKTMFVLARKR